VAVKRHEGGIIRQARGSKASDKGVGKDRQKGSVKWQAKGRIKAGKGRKKQATGTRKTGKVGEKQAKGGVKRQARESKKTGIGAK
jgi:hypothetical protein